MSIESYIVTRDKFEPENTQFSFPCCACIHRHGSDKEEPCRTCDHSATAEPDDGFDCAEAIEQEKA